MTKNINAISWRSQISVWRRLYRGNVTANGPAWFFCVVVGEVLAPLAILSGFRTRLASLVFAFNCVVAIALAHSTDLFSLNQFGGWAVELLGLFLLGAMAIFFTGGGEFTISKTNKWD